MTKLKEILETKKTDLLNIYCTAGFPEIDSLSNILPALEESGVDIVEIGIPYSDPVCDGSTIQLSNNTALNNGISLEKIFDQLETIDVNIGTVMMGYFNVILQYGIELFCERCKSCGVEGVIIPDLPIEIYLQSYKSIFNKYGLSNIYLITPETSEERVRFIDQYSDTFIYAVSSSSITGQKKSIEDAESYLSRLKRMKLDCPVLVGFNVKTARDVEFVSRYSNGSIIGSAYVNHISNSTDVVRDTKQFVKSIKGN